MISLSEKIRILHRNATTAKRKREAEKKNKQRSKKRVETNELDVYLQRKKKQIANKEYHEKNKAKHSEWMAQYYKNNKGSKQLARKEYYKNNKGSVQLASREYYKNNKGLKQLASKEYYKNNKGSKQLANKKYYEKNKNNKVSKKLANEEYYNKKNLHQDKSKTSSLSSSSFTNSNRINESSTPDQIRNCLSRDMINSNGTTVDEQLMKDVHERYNLATFVNGNPNKQQANICVVCDELIIGLEPVKYLTKEQILINKDRISVESFESHYVVQLNEELKSQYQVRDEDLHGILLSPRGVREHPQGVYSYICCNSCYNSMVTGCREEKQNPPKFAIANGFVIGHIPRTDLTYHDSEGQPHSLRLPFDPERDLDDLICSAISPVRPYGYVHAYQGGSQKSITGHFSFFSVDQSHVGGVLNKYKNVGNNEMQPSKNIFVVLCGRMTPNQKRVVRDRAKMNTTMFLHLLNWFIKRSGHRAFQDVDPPDECPDFIAFLRDEDSENNTDETVDNHLECKIEGKTYYFSDHVNNPNADTSIFDRTPQFVKSMLENSTPTMLMYGGSYLKSHEIYLEDVFPIQFPFGLGGPHPDHKRKVPVSEEACLRHYMRLSLSQFMKPDFILVCYHLYVRAASYTTGLIKCKSDYKGRSLAEKISELSIADVERAANDMSDQQSNNEPISTNDCASSFLKSVTTSCKVVGHTTEAAKDARRKAYAMSDRIGPHSVMFTLTPCDECTFRVRMYANEGKEVNLEMPNCDEASCVADFDLRAKARTNFPGACSLFYQSAIQAVYELLGWDPVKNCSNGRGIFGKCIAILRADEEQGRKTLHAHMLVWLEDFAGLCDLLFDDDEEKRENSREAIREFVDMHFQSDYSYDDSLEVICQKCCHHGTIRELFSEADLQILRDCRNKHLSEEIQGKILKCNQCSQNGQEETTISTVELNDMVIEAYRRVYGLPVNRNDQISPTDNSDCFPFSKYRRDLLTYRMPVDKDDLSPNSETFHFNQHMRHHVANRRMNEHHFNHCRSCFKYSNECRARFPEMSSPESQLVIDDADDCKSTIWRRLHEEDKDVYPFYVKSKRNVGSQYLNTCNDKIFRILACNNNIQMGSSRCLFYVVHYATKSTQKDDKGIDFERIGEQVIRRIRKERERLSSEEKEALYSENSPDDKYCFREGLSRFLLGMSVHLSQDVVSSTMAHLLICQKGSRFSFSHEFKDLLVGQMLNHLDGREPGNFVLKRRNRHEEDQEPILWPDYSVNDYIYRPDSLEDVCFYEFVGRYEKGYFTFSQMSVLDENSLPRLIDGQGMHFKHGHPGQRYSYIKSAKKEYIPKVSSPKGMICDLELLELSPNDEHHEPSVCSLEMRENYAKCALVLFYPFRGEELFSSLCDDDNCLWDKFLRLMQDDNSDDS